MNKHSAQASGSADDRTYITAITLTMLAATFLTVSGIVFGWSGWMIALTVVVVCVPFFSANILWSSKQYGFVMILLVCSLMQLGRVDDEAVRIFQAFIFSSANKHIDTSSLQQLIADGLLLAGLLITWLRFQSARNHWLTYSVGAALIALVVDALLPTQIMVATSARMLVLATLLPALVQQVRRVYDAWLMQAITSLNEAQITATVARVEQVKLHANRVIFRQDDVADQIYFIQQGQVEVLQRERHGVYEPIALLGPGQFFGEIGVISRTRRTAAVKAVTNVTLLALDQKAVTTLLTTTSATHWNDDAILRHRLVQLGVRQNRDVESTLGTLAY